VEKHYNNLAIKVNTLQSNNYNNLQYVIITYLDWLSRRNKKRFVGKDALQPI